MTAGIGRRCGLSPIVPTISSSLTKSPFCRESLPRSLRRFLVMLGIYQSVGVVVVATVLAVAILFLIQRRWVPSRRRSLNEVTLMITIAWSRSPI